MEARNLADLYGLPPLDWAPIEAPLAEGFDPGAGHGRAEPPHVLVGNRQPGGQPGNLCRDPRCTLSVVIPDFDLVVEGEARMVTDWPTIPPRRIGGPPKDGRRASTTPERR